MARKVPEINSSSQADIAFLLLCFFLMTTSMDVDYGITRRLPPPVEQNSDDMEVKKRNVLNVFINASNKLAVGPQDHLAEMPLKNLTKEVKHFMTPRQNDENSPEVEIKHIELLGDILMSKGVISLKNDRGTSYQMYIAVQNELARAFNELRDEMSLRYFNKKFNQLNEDQAKAISEAVPIRISEAEPVEIKK